MGEQNDECRKAAEYCMRMANLERPADTKSQWLVLAQSWLRMIRPGNRTASENLEVQGAAERREQEGSKSSD